MPVQQKFQIYSKKPSIPDKGVQVKNKMQCLNCAGELSAHSIKWLNVLYLSISVSNT